LTDIWQLVCQFSNTAGSPLWHKIKFLCNLRCLAGSTSALYPGCFIIYNVMLIIVNVDSRWSSVGAVNRVGARKRRNPKNFPPQLPVFFWSHRAFYSMCTVGQSTSLGDRSVKLNICHHILPRLRQSSRNLHCRLFLCLTGINVCVGPLWLVLNNYLWRTSIYCCKMADSRRFTSSVLRHGNLYISWIWMEASQCVYKSNLILNTVRQHIHFITQGNYKATCFDYRLVIFRPIFVNWVTRFYTHFGISSCLHNGIPNCE